MWRCLLNGRYTRNAATSATCAHQKKANSVSRVSGAKALAAVPRAPRTRTRPGWSPWAANSNASASNSVATTPPIIDRMIRRVAVVGQPTRLRDEPPEERPPDRDQHDHGDDVLHRADQRPEQAVERDRQDLLDDPARDDVDGADREEDEAPEDARVHQPRAPVLEHLGLDEGVLGSGRRTAVGCRRTGSGPPRGPPRTPAGGGPSQARTPRRRPRTAGRRAGSTGPLRTGRTASCGLRPPWSNGPASVSSAWSSTASIAASDSRAPFGLPGRLTTSARPMTPTTPRDRSAYGVDHAAGGAHRLGQPGHLVIDRVTWSPAASRHAASTPFRPSSR